MTLPFGVTLVQNPWLNYLPTITLREIIDEIVGEMAEEIFVQSSEGGDFPRDSFALNMLDPTAPLWRPTDECVVFYATIGTSGRDFLANSFAKSFEHRDRGVEAGDQVYRARHMLAPGDFAFGYSVHRDGTFGGGSGETERQDESLLDDAVCKFNGRVGTVLRVIDSDVRSQLRDGEKQRWFSVDNQPADRYLAACDLPDLLDAA